MHRETGCSLLSDDRSQCHCFMVVEKRKKNPIPENNAEALESLQWLVFLV